MKVVAAKAYYMEQHLTRMGNVSIAVVRVIMIAQQPDVQIVRNVKKGMSKLFV